MTYTHPYLSTPYTLCVDIEPRGTQHSSFLLPVAGVCTLATPSPLPCVTPPQGEFMELEQSGGVETRSQEQEGRLRNKEATPGGSTRGVMVASSGETLALCPVSFKWQSSYYIDIMKYMNKIVMSLRRFGWLLLCREEF